MRANEFITELFDQSYSYKWTEQSNDLWSGRFKLDGPGKPNSIEVFMGRRNLPDDPDDPDAQTWEIEFLRNYTMAVTGEGDEFKIFATVIKMISEFLNIVEPETALFSADKNLTPIPNSNKQSRVKLYTTLVDKFASKMGYQYTTSETSNAIFFTMTRDYDR